MKYYIIFSCLLFSSCFLSEELPPDQTTWKYDLPSNVNLDQFGLVGLNERIKSLEFEQMKGLIIIKNDKLVFENYYLKNSRQTLNPLSGSSMYITIAAVGIAEENGLFSLDDKIQDYLPEYADVFEGNINKTFITIRHLLLNKSGLTWGNTDFFDIKQTNDWVRYALEKPMVAPSGLQFNFNNSTGLIIAKIIENQSGQSFQDFVDQNLFQPLSISNFKIQQDDEGNYDGAFGIELSLIDVAKVGYLMLEEGIWNGRRVINPNYVEEATSVQTDVSGTDDVGYIWKRFGNDFDDFFGINHAEIYYMNGELGQHLYVIPSEDMVIAIDAENFENFFFRFANPSFNLLAEISFMIQ